jgi:transposase
MDERLPFEFIGDASLRSLLTQERARRQELEQDVLRLHAGIERQNARIIQLEQENVALRREQQDVRALIAAVEQQNALLRTQVAQLQAENDQLKGIERAPKPPAPEWPAGHAKPKTGETTQRTKRDLRHNHGRQRMAEVDETVQHAAESCPRCGSALTGGTLHRRIQVIELPPPRQVIVTEHQVIARQCPHCHRRVLPQVEIANRLGRSPFGPRLTASIATMAIVERLPIELIQERCRREYGITISVGGITGLVKRVAVAGAAAYAQLQADIRGSPVVQMDETGWRECGKRGYVWIATTPTTCYFHFDARRAGEVADGILTTDFGGVLVTDFYSAYAHFECLKQRCWAHMWRDIDDLAQKHPTDVTLAAWMTGIRTVYDQARGERPLTERGTNVDAERAREKRARLSEQQLLLLCPKDMPTARPEVTLAQRIRKHSGEFFTFVADPRVPATNNAAERNLRPLVVIRKISGGTRSAAGSTVKMTLASLAATAKLRGQNPTHIFYALLIGGSVPPTPYHTL